MFKNLGEDEVLTFTMSYLKKLIHKPESCDWDFVEGCCKLWTEPKDSSQEMWATDSYCTTAGCLRRQKEWGFL